ncbi:hypothetical protein DFH28DRAFT_902042 [Melampsora americana]|nr:hypothetical protein DFH28DRAFT_902042 [Melampsora americana]
MNDFINQISIYLSSINSSTILLFIPTLTAILIAYLQYKQIINSPFKTNPSLNSNSNSNSIKGKCENCSKEKPIKELKTCSRCKSTSNLNIYFCHQTCQKENWKSHKLNCGNFKNLLNLNDDLPIGISTRNQLESKLGDWCEFHRHLLIFATIHALDIPKNPENSIQNLFLISIKYNSTSSSIPVHQTFSLDLFQVFHYKSFLELNPGMSSAFEEIESIRTKIKSKGGLGVAMLLVRCGPVVQVIPVGLPSQSDLNSVKREKDWKIQFETSIKAGLQLNPPVRPTT